MQEIIIVVSELSVIGAGAWGTALACSMASQGDDVVIWALEDEVIGGVNNGHENTVYLPGVPLSKNIRAVSDMAQCARNAKIMIIAVPAQYMRATIQKLSGLVEPETILVSATKGIENKTLSLASDIIDETFPEEVAKKCCVLSGPTFASELVGKAPSAATVASRLPESARKVQKIMSKPFFRLYTHHDLIGVEIGGAVKNVIAIAAGISDGMGFAHNTRAALMTRGLMEMTRLGVAMGALERTFTGLSGMGDLFLTCGSNLSRNRTVGLRLGEGEKLSNILDSMKAVAEGVTTSLSLHNLAKRHAVKMPITLEVYKTLYENKPPKQAVIDLMGRTLKEEFSLNYKR